MAVCFRNRFFPNPCGVLDGSAGTAGTAGMLQSPIAQKEAAVQRAGKNREKIGHDIIPSSTMVSAIAPEGT